MYQPSVEGLGEILAWNAGKPNGTRIRPRRDRHNVWDDVHTNAVEGFWFLLKRGISGVYHGVGPQWLSPTWTNTRSATTPTSRPRARLLGGQMETRGPDECLASTRLWGPNGPHSGRALPISMCRSRPYCREQCDFRSLACSWPRRSQPTTLGCTDLSMKSPKLRWHEQSIRRRFARLRCSFHTFRCIPLRHPHPMSYLTKSRRRPTRPRPPRSESELLRLLFQRDRPSTDCLPRRSFSN